MIKHKQELVPAKVLMTTLLVPMMTLIFLSFTGPTLEASLASTAHLFFSTAGAYTWLLLGLCVGASALYFKPIFRFSMRCSNYDKEHPEEGKKDANLAMGRLNKMNLFVSLISISGFVGGGVLEMFFSPMEVPMQVNFLWVIVEAAAAGLLTKVVIMLNLDSILFPVKKRIKEFQPEVEAKFQPFYFTLMSTLSVVVVFLMVQAFEANTTFFAIGTLIEERFTSMNPGLILNMREDIIEMIPLLQVFLARMVLFGLLSVHIMYLLKRQIRNPLITIRDHLVGLNTSDSAKINSIDIVNNDEFKPVFQEINQLISRQQGEISAGRMRLENILSHAADPIISFGEQTKILSANPAAEKLFGLSESELIGTQIMAFIGPPGDGPIHAPDSCDPFFKYLENTETKIKRMRAQNKEGKIIPVEANYSRNMSKNKDFYTVILRDISKTLEIEEKLTSAKIAAEGANAMKSEFLANMSHELRTPLNAVLGFTQLMADDKNLTDAQKEKLKIISRSGSHLLGLINDILDISKIEAGKFEVNASTFDLGELIDDMKQMFSLRCQSKGLNLYVESLGDLPRYVSGDLGKIRQVLINLLSNAVKFTSHGGVSLKVGTEENDPEGNRIRFAVVDTGKGIPEDEITSILEPFTQSRLTDHAGGTGLGLAISSRFISMMDGDLEVESEEGDGSKFTFAIPLPEEENGPDQAPSFGKVIGIEGGRHPKALVVDDKLHNRLILKEMLEAVGFTIMEAENGQESIERARSFGPEMIFMDIKMPVMDGYKAVETIKADSQLGTIPVFALTASAFKHDEEKIYSSGFDGFLAKPFQLPSLFQLIQEKTPVSFLVSWEEENMEPESAGGPVSFNVQTLVPQLPQNFLEAAEDALMINDFGALSQMALELEGQKVADPEAQELVSFLREVKRLSGDFNESALQKLFDQLKEAQTHVG